MIPGYDFTRAQLAELFIKMQFPERTQRESSIIRDFLAHHLDEFDAVSFSVRVGQGLAPDPTHPLTIQQMTAFSTKKRIDILAWAGHQPYIFEVKERLQPGALGQLLAYRHLWMEDNPDAREPILGAIARTSDDDTNRVLQSHGITIYLYPPAVSDSGAAIGGASAMDAAAVPQP